MQNAPRNAIQPQIVVGATEALLHAGAHASRLEAATLPARQVTVLMPCLNEVETIGACIRRAQQWIAASGYNAEIVVADNGSTDGSPLVAGELGARVVHVPQRGYGAALFHGCMAARGEWIVMGDSDGSYDFGRLDDFVQKLREGCDLVMGNRFLGGIEPGAMPWKNRFIGNPVLTWIGRLLFACPARDFHCGLRAFSRSAFLRMDLRTTGMEFASEMVIKATLFGMQVSEVPTMLARDGRSHPPHLRPWRDGWRHLRFMLLFSPRWLFRIPGMTLFALSAIVYGALLMGPVRVGSVTFDVHTLFFAQTGLILGYLAAAFAVVVRMFVAREGLLREHALLKKLSGSPVLESGGLLGLALMLIGVFIGFDALLAWGSVQFGRLEPGSLLRAISVSTLLIIVGGITLMVSLILGFLALPMRDQQA